MHLNVGMAHRCVGSHPPNTAGTCAGVVGSRAGKVPQDRQGALFAAVLRCLLASCLAGRRPPAGATGQGVWLGVLLQGGVAHRMGALHMQAPSV
jgi:hypothetical protein